MILETVVTTLNSDGSVHIAPMGIREEQGLVLIQPFRPSTTLDNLLRDGTAVVNATDDVRIFAGCLTGRRDWPVVQAARIRGSRLEAALAHWELEVERWEDDDLRPRCFLRLVHEENHAPFRGYNRAQAAVLEAAILVSRLNRLTAEKIDAELAYLQIAIDKTAGERERCAWDWLMSRIEEHRRTVAHKEAGP